MHSLSHNINISVGCGSILQILSVYWNNSNSIPFLDLVLSKPHDSLWNQLLKILCNVHACIYFHFGFSDMWWWPTFLNIYNFPAGNSDFPTINNGAPKGGGGGGAAGLHTPNPHKLKFKKHRFCRHSDIKSFTWFTLQPKSATEIRWWLVH
jgi:hypothetical protein